MTWLTETTPKLPTAQEAAIAKLKLTEAPDLQAGHTAYTQKCASCHGEDGQGRHAPDGKVLFPPLWGQRSFNLGAGLARQQTAAGFIKHNMPLGQGMTLTDAEAWNITGYMESQQRPDFASKDKDWPKGGKPEDARY
jgi:thiosulfate dehydrogenase